MASQPGSGFPTPPPSPAPSYHGGPLPTGKATAAMVCGIVGLIVLGVILGPVALGLGLSAKNDPQQGGDGMATAGIVLGIIDIAAFVVTVVFIL